MLLLTFACFYFPQLREPRSSLWALKVGAWFHVEKKEGLSLQHNIKSSQTIRTITITQKSKWLRLVWVPPKNIRRNDHPKKSNAPPPLWLKCSVQGCCFIHLRPRPPHGGYTRCKSADGFGFFALMNWIDKCLICREPARAPFFFREDCIAPLRAFTKCHLRTRASREQSALVEQLRTNYKVSAGRTPNERPRDGN